MNDNGHYGLEAKVVHSGECNGSANRIYFDEIRGKRRTKHEYDNEGGGLPINLRLLDGVFDEDSQPKEKRMYETAFFIA